MWMIFLILVGIISMIILVIMGRGKFKKRQRKVLVIVYKTIFGLETSVFVIGIFFIFAYVLLKFYTLLNFFISLGVENLYVVQYLSISAILILASPIVYSSLKCMKKSLYKKYSYNKVLRGTMSNGVKEIIIKYIDALPIKGLIHILNLILIISANIAKLSLSDMDININVIYMSIGTYYAVDKVNDYLKKKYENLFSWIDNKLFMTSRIEEDIKISINDIKRIVKILFDNYIETGRYEINNNDKERVAELFK